MPGGPPLSTAVLGIESSCDETAAAVLDGEGRILAEAVLSQSEHARFGGVVPEIAARSHLAHLPELVAGVMRQAGLGFGDLAAVAATSGPGLIGGLIVGSGLAKGIAIARGLPFLAINHLEAHALTARLPGLTDGGAAFPYLLLLVSGGHCQCVAVDGVGRYRRLGGTIDDAVGEAFDKVAKLLGLGWPGGPALERLATAGGPAALRLSAPAAGPTRLRLQLLRPEDRRRPGGRPLSLRPAARAGRRRHRRRLPGGRHAGARRPRGARPGNDAGGRAARRRRRRRGQRGRADGAASGRAAPRRAACGPAATRLCGDNAVMVAWAAIERLRLGLTSGLDTAPRPRWPLDDPAMAPVA